MARPRGQERTFPLVAPPTISMRRGAGDKRGAYVHPEIPLDPNSDGGTSAPGLSEHETHPIRGGIQGGSARFCRQLSQGNGCALRACRAPVGG